MSPASGPPNTGDEVVVFARGVMAEDRRRELLEQLTALRRLAASEPGTLRYEWSVDRTDPSVLWAHEVYADLDALRVHRANLRPFLPALAECFRELPVPHRCAPLVLDP